MSGIYIPGVSMPKSCAKCKLFGEYGCPFIGPVGYALTRGERNEDCPLIPVPEHGRQDGLYSKYFVIKRETGEIVQDCFVLRPQKDKAAVAALLLYAEETESKELSSDIREWISTIIPAEEDEEWFVQKTQQPPSNADRKRRATKNEL